MDQETECQVHHFYLMKLTDGAPDDWSHELTDEGYERGAVFQLSWRAMECGMARDFTAGADRCFDVFIDEVLGSVTT